MDGVNIKSRTGPENYIVHPMPWMMAIPLHISSMFGIDNIKSISEDVQSCRGGPRDLCEEGEGARFLPGAACSPP